MRNSLGESRLGSAFSKMRKETKDVFDQGETKKELHDGLPVLSKEQYDNLYKADSRESGTDQVVKIDFRGYVRVSDNGGDRLVYRDILVATGIQQSEGNEGIHYGIYGVHEHHDPRSWNMQGEEEVGEYEMYVTVPVNLQREQSILCQFDDCYSVEDFRKKWPEDDIDHLYEMQHDQAESIAILLDIDPKTDLLAREKVELMNAAILKFLEGRKSLPKLRSFVNELERSMNDITEPAKLTKTFIEDLPI